LRAARDVTEPPGHVTCPPASTRSPPRPGRAARRAGFCQTPRYARTASLESAGTGTSISAARNRPCETGLSWGMLGFADTSSPSLGWMFMARPHRRALAFLGFWVWQAPCGTPRIDAGGPSACIIESRRSKGGLVRNLRAPAGELGAQANSISQRATPATWDASTRSKPRADRSDA
jgi:hypothetical protein